MTTKARDTNDSIASDRGNDPRPNYTLLGVDTDGSHHVYRTVDETIIVIDQEGRREHVQDLGGRSSHEWMAYVAQARGWTTQFLVDSFGAFLEEAIDTEEDA